MLRGERVILRAVEREDLKALHALESDVELTMLGEGAWSPYPLAAFEKNWEKHVENEDIARFVIEVDGRIIGGCGLHHQHRRDGTAQLGIGISDRDYIGRGYGREAINLLLDWAFRIQNYRRIGLDTHAINERAIRAYKACGFVEEGRLRQHYYINGTYVDAVVMGILRSEWEARQPQAPANG